LLNIDQNEFNILTPLKVYWKLKARKDEKLNLEVRDRRNAFYQIAPYWSGVMPLNHMWQLWVIPEIDGDEKEIYKRHSATVRPETEQEKKLRLKILGKDE